MEIELYSDSLGKELNRPTITGDADSPYKCLIELQEGRHITDEEYFLTYVKYVFHMIHNRIYLFTQWDSLVYHRLNCNTSTGKYLQCYQAQGEVCQECSSHASCLDKASVRRRILTSSCYPAFFRRYLRGNTPEYLHMMRKRKI